MRFAQNTRLEGGFMTEQLAKKVFPEYFKNFTMPKAAQEQVIEHVYRACRTRKIERDSFLNTYEENGFKVPPNAPPGTEADPQFYCLSTYQKLKDVKRYVTMNDAYQPLEGEQYPRPWLLARGHTTKEDGRSCMSNTWKKYSDDPKKQQKKAQKDSHVDWWLYEGAEPWLAFEVTTYEEENKTGQPLP